MKNAIPLASLVTLFCLHSVADELFRPLHGGQEIKKQGLSYEVVRKPKEILVYPPDKEKSPTPEGVTIEFKDHKGVVDRMTLKLVPPKNPGPNMYYTAPLPEKILIAGSVTFDLNFSKKPKEKAEKEKGK